MLPTEYLKTTASVPSQNKKVIHWLVLTNKVSASNLQLTSKLKPWKYDCIKTLVKSHPESNMKAEEDIIKHE